MIWYSIEGTFLVLRQPNPYQQDQVPVCHPHYMSIRFLIGNILVTDSSLFSNTIDHYIVQLIVVPSSLILSLNRIWITFTKKMRRFEYIIIWQRDLDRSVHMYHRYASNLLDDIVLQIELPKRSDVWARNVVYMQASPVSIGGWTGVPSAQANVTLSLYSHREYPDMIQKLD